MSSCPNCNLVSLTAQPLFFNASGSYGPYPQRNLVDLAKVRLNRRTGDFIYVVVATGSGILAAFHDPWPSAGIYARYAPPEIEQRIEFEGVNNELASRAGS